MKAAMKSPRRPVGPRAAAAAADRQASSNGSAIALRLGILIASSALALTGLGLLCASYLGPLHPARRMTIASRLISGDVFKGFPLGRAKHRAETRPNPAASPWRPSQSGVAWIPQPNKYLLAYCMRGQSSNRNLCLRNHFILAGLLNRTLLLPFSQQEQYLRAYDLSLRWDLDRTRRCLGSNVVTTTQDLRRAVRSQSQGTSSLSSPLSSSSDLTAEGVHPSPKAGIDGSSEAADPSVQMPGPAGPAVPPSSVRLQCWQGPREVCSRGDSTAMGDINCPEVVAHVKKPQSLVSRVSSLTPFSSSSSGRVPSELLLQLDSSSHLYNLLAPFPHSVSEQVSPLSKEARKEQRQRAGAGGGAFGAQGLLSWSTGEEGSGSQAGSRGSGGGHNEATGKGAAELTIGASCLDKAQSASQVMEAFGRFQDDVLIVGDLVENQILHPLLAGGKVEHLFELAATSMAEDCSWTVLVPSPYLLALSREIAAIVRGTPSQTPRASLCTHGAPEGCKGQDPEKEKAGSGLPEAFVRRLVLTNQAPDVALQPDSLDPSPDPELPATEQSRDSDKWGGVLNGVAEKGPLGPSGGYLSVHWRRGDFIGYCFTALKSDACTYVPKQAASCTVRHARKHGLQEIFLATNAEPKEIDTFHSEVAALSNGTMRVHMLTANFTASPQIKRWLEAHGVENATHQLKYSEAILEKLVSAQGTVFLASVESTFSKDITEMRRRLGTWKRGDSFVCHGEKEWEWDDTGRPGWMVGQLRIRRWKAKFKGAKGLTGEEKKKRKNIVDTMEWLDWRAWQKGTGKLPRWYTSNTAWKEWKEGRGADQGVSQEDRQLREWLVTHYQTVEDDIIRGITRTKQ